MNAAICCAGLLLQVLQDPAVAANVALREQISNKRAEGYQMLETLRARAKSASTTRLVSLHPVINYR